MEAKFIINFKKNKTKCENENLIENNKSGKLYDGVRNKGKIYKTRCERKTKPK